MLYAGLDVHRDLYVAAFLADSGGPLRTVRIRGSLNRLVRRLREEAGGQPLAVCFEASCDYGVVYEKLIQVAQRVVVAHPGKLRLIFADKRKHDRVDAQKLAKLLALDLVPSVHVPSMDVRSWRRLINHRASLIRRRTALKAQMQSLWRSCGRRVPRGLWKKKGRAKLSEEPWPTRQDGFHSENLLLQLEHLEEALLLVTRQLDRLGRRHPGVILLRSVPGIGPRTAEALVAWLDQPHRFAHTKQIGAYLGLVPCQDQSSSRNRLGHITREGPGVVRWLLVEAAWTAVRVNPSVRAYYERIMGADPDRQKIAIVATAHHLARVCLAMLRTGETWRSAA